MKCNDFNCRRNISAKKFFQQCYPFTFFEGLMGNTVQLCPHLYKLAIKQRVDTKMKNLVIIFSQVMQAFSCTTEAEGDLF